jgi:transcriptional regulator with XRE-family HTH domain
MIGPWEGERRPLDRSPVDHRPVDHRPVDHRSPDHRPLDHRPLLRTIVGDVLRRIRLDQGRTLADVAGEARVSMPYLSELERGRKEASSEILAAICAALDIDLSDLLDEARRELVQGPPAPVIQLDRASLDRASLDRSGPPTPGSGDVVCLARAA